MRTAAAACLDEAYAAWDEAITAIDEARKKQMAAPGLQDPAPLTVSGHPSIKMGAARLCP